MRFFLGGVPFGENNIGDEAILAGVVVILRRNFDNPEITVSTNKPEETAKLLGVKAVPLYGFRKNHPIDGLRSELKKCDVFIWSGATGLSDYPALAVKILTLAQECGLKTIVWGVGMDYALNPAFFKLGGKKLALCKAASKLSFGKIDFTRLSEDFLVRRMKMKIGWALSKCDLVVVRDFESRDAVDTCPRAPRATVGADSALIFTSADLGELSVLPSAARGALLDSSAEKIGLCISAQRAVADSQSLARVLDVLLEKPSRRMFLFGMNPVTDLPLMKSVCAGLKNADKVFALDACVEPAQILAAASLCGVVISSRLHLLILSANVSTPIVGISRGSKVDNFLNNFGLASAGTVGDCDFGLLCKKAEEQLADSSPFRSARNRVYADFRSRLSDAEKLLKESLKK